jgi:hypothetical protein
LCDLIDPTSSHTAHPLNSNSDDDDDDDDNNSILYFNVLTPQLQEPITELAQEDKYIHSKEINIKMRAKLN